MKTFLIRSSFIACIIAAAAFITSCTSDPYYGGGGYGYGPGPGYYSSSNYYSRNPYYGSRGRYVHYDVHHYDRHDHHGGYNRPRPQYQGRQSTPYPRTSTINRPRQGVNQPRPSINRPRPSGNRQMAARPNPVNPRSYSPAPSYQKPSSNRNSGNNKKDRRKR